MNDSFFMNEALKLAREAADEGEVPVGAVVVLGDEIVGRGRNRREKGKNALAHAELEAIDEACKRLGGWRLWQCDMYVTLEPCPMCAGAILQSRVPEVIYGARDAKAGCVDSLYRLLNDDRFNHQCAVTESPLAEECGQLLTDFFRALREKKKQQMRRH